MLRDNKTDPFFEIFNVYRGRVIDRLRYALERLERPFDFSIDENYPFDRTEAPFAVDVTELDDLWRRRVKNDVLTLGLRISRRRNPDHLERALHAADSAGPAKLPHRMFFKRSSIRT